MEYVQEAIATCHDFGDAAPRTDRSQVAVVVPIAAGEARTATATDVFETLAAREPARIVVPVRADAGAVDGIADWLTGIDPAIEPLWCSAPALTDRLERAGIDAPAGKGRDVWLGLGVAAAIADRVAVHDADVLTYEPTTLDRLCFPLERGYAFVKGYSARVEPDGLYGRLYRLFVRPALAAIASRRDAPILTYLRAFRYALSGSIATTAALARRVRPPPGWGLELATLGTAFDHAGLDGTAQVDLGRHVHDHRPVDGPDGLEAMAREVWAALADTLARHGVAVDPDALRDAYRRAAERAIDGYALDAAFNGLPHDRTAERRQVERYADAIETATIDRLPSWASIDLDPATVRSLAAPGRDRRPRG